MRLPRVMMGCVAVLAGFLLTSAAQAQSAPQGWQSDYEAARAAAARLNKPLLLHFYADWCGPCRAMEGTVLNTSDVLQQLGTTVIGVKINSDHHPDLATRFGVSALPTDVFVTPEGKVITRAVGSPGKQGYVARMTQVAAQYAPAQPAQLAQADEADDQPQDAAPEVGLEGFSPVALMDRKVWQKGKPEFAAECDGVTYHLGSAEELELFENHPERYAPQLKGHDPYELATRGRHVPGDIRFGAFFRNELYLLSSAENRSRFKSAPHRYAGTTLKVALNAQAD